MRWLLLAAALGACGGGSGDDAPAARTVARAGFDATPIDAAMVIAVDDAEAAMSADGATPRERRTIAITLDSTPRGAAVMIDGVLIGNTPAYWEGEVNGCVREFRFEMPGYTTARYRFVPVRDGFVHGTLDRIIEGDGGMPEVVEPEPMAPCPVRSATARPRRPTPVPSPAGPVHAPAQVDSAPADAGVPAPIDAGASAPADAAP